MAKFALLFTGGAVPGDKRRQNMRDWANWMGRMAETGTLIEGAPFGNESRVVTSPGSTRKYDWKHDSNVGGYCVVETATLDDAIALCQECPQLKEEYGGGTIEVREVLELLEPTES